MEYTMMRKRQMARRHILRWLVIGAVYASLLMGAVVVFLGMVWILKNTVYGWWLLLIGCLTVGSWLFFRLSQEGCVNHTVRYS